MAAVANVGIKQLLDAEAKAQAIIEKARKEKTALLKRAQDEAAAEIEAYRQARQREYEEYERTHMAGTEGYTKQLAIQTDQQIQNSLAQIERNGPAVVDLLLKYVAAVDTSYTPPTFV